MLFANVVLSWPSRIISLLLVQGSCLRTVLSAGRAVKLVRCLRTLLCSSSRQTAATSVDAAPRSSSRETGVLLANVALWHARRSSANVSRVLALCPRANSRLGQLWSRGVDVSRLSAMSKLSSFSDSGPLSQRLLRAFILVHLLLASN